MADPDSRPSIKVLVVAAVAGILLLAVGVAVLMNITGVRFRALSDPARPIKVPELPAVPGAR